MPYWFLNHITLASKKLSILYLRCLAKLPVKRL